MPQGFSSTITTTGVSGRVTVTLAINYTLKNLENGRLVSSGSTSVNYNYDFSANRYANYKAGNYIQTNLTKVAAQNIRNSLVNDLIELKRDCVAKEKSGEEKSPNCRLLEG